MNARAKCSAACLAFAMVISMSPSDGKRAVGNMAGRSEVCAFKPARGWASALKPRGRLGPELVLARSGKADCVILLPAAPTTQERKAADELKRWLGEMTGADFKVVREGEASVEPGGRVISIGNTNLLRDSRLAEARLDLGRDGYAIAVKGNVLFLLGGTKRGPINAVYALLEEDLGCRWYDKYSASIPRVRTLRFRPVPRHYVPQLDIRDPYHWDAFDVDWAVRNRTNAPGVPVPEEWGGSTDYAMFVHTYNRIIDPEDISDHPEWFSEHNGKRDPTQLCLTNPDVFKMVVKRVRQEFKGSPQCEIVSVSPNDTTGYCECANCKAIDDAEGANSGTLIWFCNKVADAVKDEYPDKKISTLAYLGTFMPPKTIRPRDNVAIQLCTDTHAWSSLLLTVDDTPRFQAAMKAWDAIGATMHIWDYTCNLSYFPVITPNMPVVERAFDFYVQHRAQGIMTQTCGSTPGCENAAMRSWVYAKKMWNPQLEFRDLMRDFIFGYYGDAAQPVWDYNMMLWKLWEDYHGKPLDKDNPITCGIRYQPNQGFLTRELLDKSLALFAQAEALAEEPVTKCRVTLAKLPVLYTRICQEVGFVNDDQYFISGKSLKSGNLAGLPEMVDELESACAIEGVTSLGERNVGAADTIALWKSIARLDRAKTSLLPLSNEWRFKPDPQDVGAKEEWFAPGLDDSDWALIRGDKECGWEKQGFEGYTGVGWYRQKLTVLADMANAPCVGLYFSAVDEEAEVYINGKRAFDHTTAATGRSAKKLLDAPFSLDAKPFIKPGQDNVIAVRVISNDGRGGVWRPAYLAGSDQKPESEEFRVAVRLLR